MVKTPFILPMLYPAFEWKAASSGKEIFLTFDDGPIPEVTEFVLETLKAYQAKATFFCIGDNIRKHPEVFAGIMASGHRIGNHTFHHLNGWKTDDDSYYLENVQQCQTVIDESYHAEGRKLFRPPYGRIRRRQAAVIAQDYRIIMWSVLTKDYNASIHKEDCLSRSLTATGEGSIVLFHDSLKAEKNMSYVLPRFLDHFSGQGYTFKTL